MLRAPHLAFVPLAAALIAGGLARGQTVISGALSDSTTGPLGPGVYHVVGGISVPGGQTLTVSAGAILKFNLDNLFSIDGRLDVNGLPGNPVIFTEIRDDSAGGDTNGDGATTPTNDYWRGLQFNSTSGASTLDSFEVRYGGRNGYGGIEIFDADIALSQGLVRNCTGNGIDLNSSSAHPSVSSCSLQSNGSFAIRAARLDALPGFNNNTASGNGFNAIEASVGAIATNTTIVPQNGINGAVVVPFSASVPAGLTLSLQAGTVLKFALDGLLTVDGTLTTAGSVNDPVVFTEWRDDSIGGDSNGDGGSSTPTNDYWRGIVLNSTAGASVLSRCEVRYGGRNGYAGIEIVQCNPTLTSSKVHNCTGTGIDLNASAAYPTVSACTLQANGGYAIRAVRFDALPGFSNNTALANGFNLIEASVATLAASTTVAPANGINGVVFLSAGLNVPAGLSLTVQAGTIFKMGLDNLVTIDGTLATNGAVGNPVIFTELRDDTGGDTNGDGNASTPSNDYWRGIVLDPSASASTLHRCEVRYAGRNGYAGIEVLGSNPTLTNCTVRNCTSVGLDLNSGAAYPMVSACAFQQNGGMAIRGVRLDALPGFSANTATGNANNLIEASVGTIANDVTITATNGINSAIWVPFGITVPLGKTLGFGPNVVVKMGLDNLVFVDGTLNTSGSSGNAVVFTEWRDDSAGGDTNGDGNSSTPTADYWRGLQFNTTADASNLDFCEVRYAGRNGYAGVEILDADIGFTRSIVRNCTSAAIDLNSTHALPRINRCQIQNNGLQAIRGVHIDAVPFITRNFATGNGLNQMQVTVGTPTADLYLPPGAGVNDVIVMGTNISVPGGLRLRLGPGVHIKMPLDGLITIDGALDVEGTDFAPAILTDYRDDSVGGDNNGDGASVGTPDWWRGVVFNAGATASEIEYLELRFGGRNGYHGLTCFSPSVSLRRTRVQRCTGGGFYFTAAARADFLVSWANGSTGIRLEGGAFDLRHASVQSCGLGVWKNGGGWTGDVVDTIAWGNTTKFTGLIAADIRYSNGFAGGLGNIDTDPLFVNAANGDLHLQPGSPCIGTGDPFSELDSDCSGTDMGAYPKLGSAAPQLYCTGKANSAGCVPFLAYSGFASASSSDPFDVRAFNVVSNKNGLFFYGFSGASASPFQGGTKCVANPVKRLPVQASGGNAGVNDCSGVYEFDFNALIQGGSDPLLVPGATVNTQCWYRDPQVASSTGLSNGLQFEICN